MVKPLEFWLIVDNKTELRRNNKYGGLTRNLKELRTESADNSRRNSDKANEGWLLADPLSQWQFLEHKETGSLASQLKQRVQALKPITIEH